MRTSPGEPTSVDLGLLREERLARLQAAMRTHDLDGCLLFSEPNVEALLEDLRPDVHAKGTDYTTESVPERATSARLGIRVAIVGDPKHHSTREFLDSVRKAPHA